MSNYKTKWTEYKGFIIGWDSNYLCYGAWEKEPNWDEYNCVGAYHKTIEEVRQEIDNFNNKGAIGE